MKFNIIDIDYFHFNSIKDQKVSITVAKLVKIYNDREWINGDNLSKRDIIVFEFITEDKKPYIISIPIKKDISKFHLDDVMQSLWYKVKEVYTDKSIVDKAMFREIVDKVFE